MYDSIIIGSGIAGMTAAIYLRRSNKKILLLEKDLAGGQIIKSSSIQNYPGFLGNGSELLEKLLAQLKYLNIEITHGNAVDIESQQDKKIVKTEKQSYETKTVVIATGRIPRKQNLKNLEKLTGHGVSYCASCDAFFYRDEDVIVQGGGNSSLEESLLLSDVAKTVTIIHRRDEFTAEPILIDQVMKKKNIKIKFNRIIEELLEENGRLKGIKLDDGEIIDGKALFIYIGLNPATNFLNKLGIKTENDYIIVDKDMKTSIDGIYACGDIIKKDLYQLVTAASDGAIAAVNIIKYIKNN
ncbi:MAG: NAD(P)/FAD-dependent oxidoreductase [Clostridium sp.]|nr:NAD(P)/FAD-dependent oxidoreductase [Clostridium sp.]MCM1443753.1 NAD(P)/FAD-dependent oxidoreductase [Candidatus Amulumruptor caecigallinarius]